MNFSDLGFSVQKVLSLFLPGTVAQGDILVYPEDKEWVCSIFAAVGKGGYQGVSGHSPASCGRQLIGHCGRWGSEAIWSAMRSLSVTEQEFTFNGCFPIRRTGTFPMQTLRTTGTGALLNGWTGDSAV
jgi:hypothetical protein